MSFPIPICAACGIAVFPPRALCPSCGGRFWVEGETNRGLAEQVTERAGVRIASVRTDLGPLVVARVAEGIAPGDSVLLEADGGVPVGRPE